MKKTALSFLMAIFCMIAFAQPGHNGTPQLPQGTVQPKMHWQPQGHQFTSNEHISLMIFSPSNERFWLYINNQLMMRQSSNVIKVDLAPNVIYNIKVMMDNRGRDAINESICIGGNSDDVVLTVQRSQGHGRMPGHYRLRWNGQKINAGEGNYTYIWLYKNDPRGVRFAGGMDINPIVPPTPQPTPQPGHHGQPGQPGQPGHHGNPGAPQQPAVQPAPPAPQPCPAPEFQKMKNMVRSQTFENDRMNVALQAIRGKLPTAEQIADLAELFKFENDRLSFLKSAYGECFDKTNYYVVYRVLTFSSSKDELTKYIQGR
ncbi:MAG: DUF4476 domain-containing protein [Bacteroidales bacterium]|nr:DUF4476 domain-containing protein [Bacteroidales bacterium]